MSKYFDEVKISENFENFAPPLINFKILNSVFLNVKQRNKPLQDAQKILELFIVPMISLSKVFKTNKLEMKKKEAKNVFQIQLLLCDMQYTSCI